MLESAPASPPKIDIDSLSHDELKALFAFITH
ncbi:phage portal protein [Xenorhabdus szentirmaii DSM 16338]|nr:phage portal protein [Xenorhabdus szentirmaii DSM 16338]